MALSRKDKQALATALVEAVANLFESDWNSGYWNDIKDIPREEAAEQASKWLSRLPTGGDWDMRLPVPDWWGK